MACINSTLIVGAGIAGLVSAIALARQGIQCEIVDPTGEPLGASIIIGTPDALEEIGVLSECLDVALINPIDETPKISFGIYRPLLSNVLRAAARKHGVVLRFGVSLTGFEDHGDHSEAHFSDGTSARYDLIIGADGIRSTVRQALFGEKYSPRYSGQSVMRWMVPGVIEGRFPMVWTPTGKMFTYPVPEMMYFAWLFAFEKREVSDQEAYHMLRDQLGELIDGHPFLRDFLARLKPDSKLIFRPFEWLFVDEPWYRGRAVIIGDAAHSTTAHLASGGGMAIEDGVVLGQELGRADTLEAGLKAFHERRFRRTKFVVETSLKICRLELEGAGAGAVTDETEKAFEVLGQPY